MEELMNELKSDIVEVLDLKEIIPEDFSFDTPLFVQGLGLDSIDALEIVVLLEKKYNTKIEDPRDRRSALLSIRTIAEYITKHKKV
jgi:acyl carrier protein